MSPNNKVKNSKYNPLNYWDKPIGKIAITVIGGTIVLLIGFVLNHLLIPSKKETASTQQTLEKSSKSNTPTKHHTHKPDNIFTINSTTAPKAIQPQINAPNSVISVNQQGGITANTVNVNL